VPRDGVSGRWIVLHFPNFGGFAEVELAEDAGDVGLHGRLADDQLGGDLGVGETAREALACGAA
jgi:hypothetical protein